MLKEYEDVFTGIGCMPNKHKIVLNEKHEAVVQPPRRIPLALQDKLKATLNSLEKQNVIQWVTKPTEWAHNLVIVEKPNGKLRICLDP